MIYFVIALLIVSIYYFYIYRPVTVELKELRNTRIEKQNELDYLIFQARQIPDLKEERDSYLAQKNRLEEMRMSVADLLVVVNRVARNKDLEILNFNPLRAGDRIELEVRFRGGYRQISEALISLNLPEKRLEFLELDLRADNQREIIIADIFLIHHRDQG